MTRDLRARRTRRRQLMKSLQQARPDRLSARYPPAAEWPDASHFAQASDVEPAGLATRGRHAGTAQVADSTLRSSRRRASGGQSVRKLIPAAAAAVSVIIVIGATIALGTDLGSLRHHPHPVSSAHIRPVKISFRGLRPARSWHGHIAYGVINGIVYLSGSAGAAGSGTPGLLTTLPPGARPAHTLYVLVTFGRLDSGEARISPDGQVTALALSSAAAPAGQRHKFVSISGVSFPLGA